MRGKVIYGRLGAKQFFVDDVEVTEEEFHATFPTRIEDILASGLLGHSATKTCWPMRSRALAVHPKQVDQANARNRRHGLASYYEKDGTAVLPTREERKKLNKLDAMHDNEGGYGD